MFFPIQTSIPDVPIHLVGWCPKAAQVQSDWNLAFSRRFAYTTPKSFLELIKLYTSMVGMKDRRPCVFVAKRLAQINHSWDFTSKVEASTEWLIHVTWFDQGHRLSYCRRNCLIFFVIVVRFCRCSKCLELRFWKLTPLHFDPLIIFDLLTRS